MENNSSVRLDTAENEAQESENVLFLCAVEQRWQ